MNFDVLGADKGLANIGTRFWLICAGLTLPLGEAKSYYCTSSLEQLNLKRKVSSHH